MMFAWVLWTGCEPKSEGAALVITGVVVESDTDHNLVVYVAFETSVAASTFVRFGEDGDLRRSSPADASAKAHKHMLLGNKAGRTLSVQPVAVVEGVETVGETITFEVPPVPAEVPEFTLTSALPGSQVAGGYVVLTFQVGAANNPQHYVGIIDGEADWVWLHPITEDYGTSAIRPSLDGNSLVWTEYDNFRDETDGFIYKMELDGDVVSYTVAPTIHHAVAELPGEQFAYLGRRFIETTPAESGGNWLMPDSIMVVPEGDDGTGAEVLFDYFDDWWGGDLGQYWLSPCYQLLLDVYGRRNVCEMTHTNSLAYVASENALYAYPRLLDTLLKVDVATGDLVWQLSGVHSDFTFANGDPLYASPDETYLWSQGHFSQVWSGGLVLFDNGVNYTPEHSGLAEFSWTYDAETNSGTVEEVWRYDDPLGGYTYALGDARKLASGSVLSSWMSLGYLAEVAVDGRELWRVDTEQTATRRIFFVESLYDLRTNGEGTPTDL